MNLPLELLHFKGRGTGLIGYMMFDPESGDHIFVTVDNSDAAFRSHGCRCPCPWPHVHPAVPPWEWNGAHQWVNDTTKDLPKNRRGAGWFDRCRN